MAGDCAGGSVQRKIRYAIQTDFETVGTDFKYQSLAQNADDEITQENIVSEGLENVNVVQNTAGTRQSTTSAEFDYQVGRVFGLAFGSATHVETTGDWVHTFNVNNVPPYLTVVVGSDAVETHANRHVGHLVDSFVISFELNGNVKIDVSTVGAYDEAVDTIPAHTALNSQVLTAKNVNLTFNSVAIPRIQSGTITVTHATEPIHGTDDEDMQCNVFLGRTVDFTISASANTDVYKDHIKNQDVTSIGLAVNNGVTLGSGRRGFDATFNKIVITGLEEAGSVGSITTFTISGTMVFNTLTATDGISDTDW